MPPFWPQHGVKIFHLCYKTRSRGLPGGSGRPSRWRSKIQPFLEVQKHRFPIDFGTVWERPEPLKIVFSYHSRTDFTNFGHLNIKCNSSCEKHRFRLRFGGPSWHRKCTCWPWEANMSEKNFFWGFQERSKTQLQLKSLLNQMIHFKTPKLDPWGEGRERGKID